MSAACVLSAADRADVFSSLTDVLNIAMESKANDYEITEIANKLKETFGDFNYMCLGHFHKHFEQELLRGGILANGSFVGGDVYSMQNLRTRSKPTQLVFGVHPTYGMTWQYKLDLDHARE